MKRVNISRFLLLATLVAVLTLLLGTPLLAQTGGGYDLTWSTVDSGGYTFSRGGGYTLGGTVGQPDAGALSGGGFTLSGGFWSGAAVIAYEVYLPLVVRDSAP
jgi:hypothetical protein